LTIRTYTPKVLVTLMKNIRRDEAGVSQRYSGSRAVVDLTPFMGEHGGVTVSKSIYAPFGQWTVTLADRRDTREQDGRTSQDTLYAMVEPMDGIEIRLAREPHQYGGELPIVMRGFVSRVRRSETMGANGQPQRQVVIEGGDYGLAFQRVRLSWLLEAGTGAVLTNYGRLEATGLTWQAWAASDFVRDVVTKTINPWLEEFYGQSVGGPSNPAARRIDVVATVDEGTVNPYGIQPFDRPVWEWMAEHCDLTWNELFVEDQDAGPVLVYRPQPFKDIRGEWIPQGSSKVGTETYDIRDDAVVSLDVSRSDTNVANVFWANPSAVAYVPESLLKSAAFQQGTILDSSKNSSVDLYGPRLMSVTMAQGPTGMGRPSGLPPAEQAQAAIDFNEWAIRRRRTIMDFNRDNVVFEDVSMDLRGDERIKPGRYLRVRRGGFAFECYVHAVTHDFRPFRSFTTRVQAIRGTGLLERSKLQASPYGAEGKAGAYG
jgi:hypothetical protein